jgi:hypothetical protein
MSTLDPIVSYTQSQISLSCCVKKPKNILLCEPEFQFPSFQNYHTVEDTMNNATVLCEIIESLPTRYAALAVRLQIHRH